jgi:hypothetical protein
VAGVGKLEGVSWFNCMSENILYDMFSGVFVMYLSPDLKSGVVYCGFLGCIDRAFRPLLSPDIKSGAIEPFSPPLCHLF